MEMNLASDKIQDLIDIRNIIKDVLPGDISIYGLDAPHEEIFVVDIRDSGGMEEVSIFYDKGTYVINFWTCKQSIPNYDAWIAKYILCTTLLIERTPSVKELDCQVLLNDGDTQFRSLSLKNGLYSLMEILQEHMEIDRLPRS